MKGINIQLYVRQIYEDILGGSHQGVCSRILYCKVHDYLKSKSNNSSLKWMKIADSKYRGRLA